MIAWLIGSAILWFRHKAQRSQPRSHEERKEFKKAFLRDFVIQQRISVYSRRDTETVDRIVEDICFIPYLLCRRRGSEELFMFVRMIMTVSLRTGGMFDASTAGLALMPTAVLPQNDSPP